MNKSNYKLKINVINEYGGICKDCGEDNLYFLCIDHVFNDGAEERKKIGSDTHKLYRKLRKENYPTNRYQLLCYNCNWKKELNLRKKT